MRVFIEVENGRFLATISDKGEVVSRVDADPTDDDELARFGKALMDTGVMAYMGSSSIDFPEEYGLPKGFDVPTALQRAIDLAEIK